MRNKKLLPLSIGVIIIFFSCKKTTLDVPPIGLVDQSLIANDKGVEGLLIAAYSMLDGFSLVNSEAAYHFYGSGSNWIYGSICGTEAYKGSTPEDQSDVITPLETFTATSKNDGLASKWAAAYAGVQRANEVLRVMAKATDIDSADRRRIAAEARFLRGFFHFEAIKVFGNVPYVDESVTYAAGNYYLSNDTLIWPAIERDFRFAKDNLPGKMIAVGRVNKYSAEAFLAKACLFQRKYTEAKPLLEDLINNGVTAGGIPYGLRNLYADNFNPQTKNNEEAVFSVQVSVNDGSNGFNGNIGDILNFPNGIGGCCGFFQPSQYLVNHFKTDSVTGLPDLDHFNEIDIKNDEGILTSDPFTPETGTLDPRLDWTVGRRSIPYLDWGLDLGGVEWVRDYHVFTYGPYSPIKNVYKKSQKGHFSDPNFWTAGSTANNINLVRFADILLWAAEVEVEIGSPGQAEIYVNRIRNRMADHHEGWVHSYLDDNNPEAGFYPDDAHLAANYFIKPYPEGYFSSHGQDFARKAVHYERMLELAMEGHRFFDLVRWGIADTEINNYLQHEKRSYFAGVHFRKFNEIFPIPQMQIDLSPGPDGIKKLKQNPGY